MRDETINYSFFMLSIVPSIAVADDVDKIKQSVQSLHDALNKGDADTVAKYFLPEASQFLRTACRLEPIFTDTHQLKTQFDTGLKYKVKIRNLDAKVYGYSAIATCFTTGFTAYPDGTVLEDTLKQS